MNSLHLDRGYINGNQEILISLHLDRGYSNCNQDRKITFRSGLILTLTKNYI